MPRLRRVMLACVVVIVQVDVAAADDLFVSRDQLDRWAWQTASNAVDRGVPMYNGGNHQGCLRLYGGALLAIRTILDHRPELLQFVDDKRTAASSGTVEQAAFLLRDALDEVLRQCAAPRAWSPLDDDELSGRDLDRRALQAETDAVYRGVPMYNSGNHQGCYRLYQGTLIGLRLILGHRPELTQIIDRQMDLASRAATASQSAWALRRALDEVFRVCGSASAPAALEGVFVDVERVDISDQLASPKSVDTIIEMLKSRGPGAK